ncbi:glycosyltransferase [Anaerocolumna sp. AGMB13025]|uniref:glycosyltransferase n=1 Tax=Anaerocolumna sp. AGMB13025 TaxID=3039116 RepID=UPI00241E142F|nr:glycosyltransferase [Anaerocolumna sp. AGMB13025]WFR57882.1 glycosyltransferase [Anaerocolumna sp. AGMB13025]
MKFATVVVTFNRKNELVHNIQSVLSQTRIPDMMYIIDNHGSDDTKGCLEEKGFLELDNLNYIYLDENVGGAGGFHVGTKLAYKAGYDYICLMDDDGYPFDKNTFENIIKFAEKLHDQNEKLLLNSLVFGKDDIMSFRLPGGIKTKKDALAQAKDNMIADHINPFNGTFISKELVAAIGYPNKDFFIKGDEEDFTWRARNAGAFIATITNSYYFHPILEKKHMKILGKVRRISTEAPWKEYYRVRNYTYMFKRSKEYKKMLRQPLRQIAWAVIAGQQKNLAIKLIIRGFLDGFFGKLGNTVKP